jgi:hypothetical protein
VPGLEVIEVASLRDAIRAAIGEAEGHRDPGRDGGRGGRRGGGRDDLGRRAPRMAEAPPPMLG